MLTQSITAQSTGDLPWSTVSPSPVMAGSFPAACDDPALFSLNPPLPAHSSPPPASWQSPALRGFSEASNTGLISHLVAPEIIANRPMRVATDQVQRNGLTATRPHYFVSPDADHLWSAGGGVPPLKPSGAIPEGAPERHSPGNQPDDYENRSDQILAVPRRQPGHGAGPDEPILTGTHGRMSLEPSSRSSRSVSITMEDGHPSVSPAPSLGETRFRKRSTASGDRRRKPRRKAHNDTERRYRVRLNGKIAELRYSIPSLREGNDVARCDDLTVHASDAAAAHRVNKAHVLDKATEYIRSLEQTNRQLEAELEQFRNLYRHHASRPMQSLPTAPGMIEHRFDHQLFTLPTSSVHESAVYASPELTNDTFR